MLNLSDMLSCWLSTHVLGDSLLHVGYQHAAGHRRSQGMARNAYLQVTCNKFDLG